MGYGSALEAREKTLECMGTQGALNVLKHMWNVSDDDARYFADHVRASLVVGDLYHWEPEIVDLIDAAYPSMPAWTLTPESLPTPHGFFYFAKPIEFPEVEGHLSQALQAITWMSVTPMVDVDVDMELAKEVEMSGLVLVDERKLVRDGCSGGHEVGDSFPPTWKAARATGSDDAQQVIVTFYQVGIPQLPLAPVTYMRYEMGQTLNEMTDLYREELQERGDYARWSEAIYKFKMQVFACCLSFVEQRIVRSESKKAPRAIRRRIERKSGRRAPKIRVVQLRRPTSQKKKGESQQPVDWDCRWMVRGHWRQQWYATQGVHKPKWIYPFVKGPPDKPLKPPTERIFDVAK